MSLPKALFDKTLFAHDMKRYRALLITFSILMFVGGPLILIFMFSVSGEKIAFSLTDRDTLDFFSIATFALDIFSLCASSITAFAVCHRFTSQNSAYFYNSLPVKRSAAFITDNLAALATYAVCLIVNGLAAWIVLVLGSTTSPVIPLLLVGKTVLEGFAVFIIHYSVYILAGQICSSVFSHIVFGATLVTYPTALFAIIITVFGSFDQTFGTEFYMKYAWKFSPLCGLFENAFSKSEGMFVDRGYYIPWLIVTALCFAVSAVIFINRKSENAGEPLSMKWTKYLMRALYIIPASLGFAVIFYNLSEESILWLIIGFAVGALLSFMAINAIVFKSVAKLFDGIISFAIICAVSFGLLLCVKANVLGINNVPAKENVKAISVSGLGQFAFDDDSKFEDSENIAALYDIFADAQCSDCYDNFEKGAVWADVIFYTKSGLPCAKHYNSMIMKPEDDENLQRVKSSKEYLEKLKHGRYGIVLDNRTTATVKADMYASGTVKIDTQRLASCIEADFDEGNFEEKEVYGYFSVIWKDSTKYEHYDNITVYRGMKNTVDYLKSVGCDLTEEHIIESAVNVKVYNGAETFCVYLKNPDIGIEFRDYTGDDKYIGVFTDSAAFESAVENLIHCVEPVDGEYSIYDVSIELSDGAVLYACATDWEQYENALDMLKSYAEYEYGSKNETAVS